MSSIDKRERGFTLIELMISMALGIVVSIAAVQLFITGFSSYNLQRGLGDVNENGRFGLEFLARNIRVAQYSPTIGQNAMTVPQGAVVFAASQLPAGTADLVSGNNTITVGLSGNSDQLVVRTWVPTTDNTQRDCEGNAVTGGRYVVSRFFLRADTASGSSSALVCDAGTYVTPSDAAVTGFGGTGVVLLPTVDNFQVLYGVAAAGSTTLPIVRYVTSADIGTSTVLAVRIAALVRSSETVNNLRGTSPSYNLLGESLTPTDTNILRRVFVSTVALRNAI